MAKPTFENLLVFVIVTGTAFAVGCGDGSKHKQRIPRSGVNNKGTTGAIAGKGTGTTALVTGGTAAAGSGTSADAAAAAAAGSPASDADKKTQQQIKDLLSDTSQAREVSISQFEDGTYTIDSITTHYVFKPSVGGAEIYTASTLQGSDTSRTLVQGQSLTWGVMNDDKGDDGRSIAFPEIFTVDQSLGQWRPLDQADKPENKPTVLFTQEAQEGTKLVCKDNLKQDLAGKQTDLSLMDLLSGAKSSTDKTGITLMTTPMKLANGNYRVEISIDEDLLKNADQTKSNKLGGKIREVLFTYKFVKKPVAAAAPTDATPATPAASPDTAAAAAADAGATPASDDAATKTTMTPAN